MSVEISGNSSQSGTKERSGLRGSAGLRISRVLASRGVSSRRGAEDLIRQGLVYLNGKKVYELGTMVLSHDDIRVVGVDVGHVPKKRYYVLNKPRGVITSVGDPLGRPSVMDFIPKAKSKMFPVGRLDWDSEGLILITNDGEFANRVMSPTGHVTKTYLVKLKGTATDSQIRRLRRGITIKDGKVKAVWIDRHPGPAAHSGGKKSHQNSWIKIVVDQGKNRQIRYMLEKIGHDVLRLQRIAIGKLRIGSMKKGEVKEVTEDFARRVFVPDIPLTFLNKKI
jgi:23S rRNA pseudouridine2605 synthase